MYYNMRLLLITALLIFFTSCNKEESESKLISTIGLQFIEITDPPAIPLTYSNDLIEPKILVKCTNKSEITEVIIGYSILIGNSGSNFESGPLTIWHGAISENEEQNITLNSWDTITGNAPLCEGTHLLRVSILSINGLPDYKGISKDRVFKLEY